MITGVCGADPAEEGFDDPNVGTPTRLNTLSKWYYIFEEGDVVTLFGELCKSNSSHHC